MSITPEYICQVLNEAWEADPVTIHSLICTQTVVNDTLAEHPSIQVRLFKSGNESRPVMTLIGLVNGFLGPNPDKYLCTKWSDEHDEHGVYQFLGFDLIDAENVVFKSDEL